MQFLASNNLFFHVLQIIMLLSLFSENQGTKANLKLYHENLHFIFQSVFPFVQVINLLLCQFYYMISYKF